MDFFCFVCLLAEVVTLVECKFRAAVFFITSLEIASSTKESRAQEIPKYII